MSNSQLFEVGSGALSGTVAALGTCQPVNRYNRLTVHITGLTSETISATISVDGGTTFSTTLLAFGLISTPATQTVTALTNATYVCTLPPCAAVKFTKSSTTDPAVLLYYFRQS